MPQRWSSRWQPVPRLARAPSQQRALVIRSCAFVLRLSGRWWDDRQHGRVTSTRLPTEGKHSQNTFRLRVARLPLLSAQARVTAVSQRLATVLAMPSPWHDGVVQIFRDEPNLVLRILRDCAGADVPTGLTCRLESAAFNDRPSS